MYYLNITSLMFELWDMVQTTDSDLTANAFQQHKTPSAILSLLGSLKGLFPYPRWAPNRSEELWLKDPVWGWWLLNNPFRAAVISLFGTFIPVWRKEQSDSRCFLPWSFLPLTQNFCANIRGAYTSFFFIPNQFPFHFNCNSLSWHWLRARNISCIPHPAWCFLCILLVPSGPTVSWLYSQVSQMC